MLALRFRPQVGRALSVYDVIGETVSERKKF